MIDFRKNIDKAFACLDYLMSILAVFFGFNLIIINSKKLDFAFIRTLENIIAEYKATKNITNGNLKNMVLLILILSGFVLTSFAIPHLIDMSKTLIIEKIKNHKTLSYKDSFLCYNLIMNFSKQLEEVNKNRRAVGKPEVKMTNRHIEMLQILREAPEHPAVKYNSKYFENLFKVANITILRIAQDLRDLNLIETKHQQYVLKEGFDEWDEMFDKDAKNQIVLIAGIKGLLQQYKDTPLFDNIEKLFYLFEPKIAKSSGLLSSARIAVPPQMEFNIKENNWDKILRAMEQNKKIKARYVAPWYKPEKNEIQRTLWPYQILLDNGTVYLFAHSEHYGEEYLYDINKFEGITITNEEFELPEDFDFTKRCKGGRLGAFSSDKVEKYEIEVSGFASYWIKDHKWADDQTFEELDEEDVIIRFSSCQFAKVKEFVLSLGSGAKPLAPKRLVNEWKKEVTAMFENMNR